MSLQPAVSSQTPTASLSPIDLSQLPANATRQPPDPLTRASPVARPCVPAVSSSWRRALSFSTLTAPALAYDVLPSAHPLSRTAQPIASLPDVDNLFDQISYEKVCAVGQTHVRSLPAGLLPCRRAWLRSGRGGTAGAREQRGFGGRPGRPDVRCAARRAAPCCACCAHSCWAVAWAAASRPCCGAAWCTSRRTRPRATALRPSRRPLSSWAPLLRPLPRRRRCLPRRRTRPAATGSRRHLTALPGPRSLTSPPRRRRRRPSAPRPRPRPRCASPHPRTPLAALQPCWARGPLTTLPPCVGARRCTAMASAARGRQHAAEPPNGAAQPCTRQPPTPALAARRLTAPTLLRPQLGEWPRTANRRSWYYCATALAPLARASQARRPSQAPCPSPRAPAPPLLPCLVLLLPAS